MYISDIQLDMVRKKPLAYLSTTDPWLLNFALLNMNMQIYNVRLNPESGSTDEHIADWVTLHKESVVDWFFENYQNTDVFIPL